MNYESDQPKFKEALIKYKTVFYNHLHYDSYRFGKNMYNTEYITNQIKTIHSLHDIRKTVNYTIKLKDLDDIPVFTAIKKLAHPYFVEHLWKLMGKKEIYVYNYSTKYNKMPHIYDLSTNTIMMKPAIKDLIEWIYTIYKYDKCNADFLLYVSVLDEYAKIFEIEYEKREYEYDHDRRFNWRKWLEIDNDVESTPHSKLTSQSSTT
jgi:hypothetical protein